jgi:NAD(P)-dependent dehydrogenase (short-subunit alcohol dehydrogenase family)
MTDHSLSPETTGTAPGRGRLAGRRVLVVGAGTRPTADPDAPPGNGRAIAALAAREGAAVACADVALDAAETTARLIAEEGGRAVAVACDVRDGADCDRAVAETIAALGGLDGVVLNVGIASGKGVVDTTTEEWDDAFAVNVRGHFQVLRAALPHLERGASIVFVSSTAAQAPSFVASYDASKVAVEGLARHVASAYAAAGVRANVVSPCAVDTPLGRLYAEQSGLESLDDLGLPMRRAGTPWEVAYASVFLLSDEAAYTTGSVLFVDGGFMVNGAHG